MKRFIFSFLFISFSLAQFAQNNGYSIGVTIDGFANQSVILGHYFASQTLYPDDTAQFDDNNHALFEGDKSLGVGLYFIYLPSGQYFELVVGEDQHFTVETDSSDYVKNMKVFGSADNQIFFDFQQYMLSKQDEMKMLQETLKDSTYSEKQKEKIRSKITELNSEREKKVKEIVADNPGLFASRFLNATIDIEIPEAIKDDKAEAYKYYKKHYFDNFDLSDVSLLFTPLYEGKMKNYLDNMVIQMPDSLNKEIDFIIEKARADSAIFRYVLITLFNTYAKSQIMGMDAVQVHIADKYYIDEAWWSDQKFKDELKERVEILTPILIGKKAPDEQLRVVPKDHFIKAANDTALKKFPHAGYFMNISNVDAEYTVLVFWEANCSHCKKVVPDLYKIYQDTLSKSNIEVVAINTLFGEDGKEKWVDFVNRHKLYDWINAWNPYEYKYKINYDIRSTPQIYVLNKEKEIIGKKLGPENVLELITAYKKTKEKESE
ncbi:MAG: DUF5106 domain-containing protein [Bacteroidales bacterium]|nr:DUF5106 domain-containing protein [Bacteroidales bacterium]MBN2821409.1 DUF5106 domain-containing protein [Bacteroidales bacterium]